MSMVGLRVITGRGEIGTFYFLGSDGSLNVCTSDLHRLRRKFGEQADDQGGSRSWSQVSKRPFEELSSLSHVLFNVRLEMSGSCLPIVCRVADAAGEEDKLA